MNTDELFGDRFHMAVRTAAETMNSPPYAGERLEKATELVLAGGVTLHEDGSATVKSGSHTYEIDAVHGCTCADSQHRSKYCKHFMAVEILKRASSGAASQINGTAPPTPETPLSSAWQVQEAPASCCLKFTRNKIEIMYTMRDVNDEALFPRVSRVLDRLLEPEPETPKAAPSPDWCPIHNITMRQYSKDNRQWYAHRLENGSWCHGK